MFQRRQPAAPHRVGAVGHAHHDLWTIRSALFECLALISDVTSGMTVPVRVVFKSVCVSCPAPAALNPQTIVELFYQTVARRLIVSQLFSNQQGGALLVWTDVISSVVQLLAQLLYPSSCPDWAPPLHVK